MSNVPDRSVRRHGTIHAIMQLCCIYYTVAICVWASPVSPMIRFSVWLYRLAGWERTALTLLALVPLWALVYWALQGAAS